MPYKKKKTSKGKRKLSPLALKVKRLLMLGKEPRVIFYLSNKAHKVVTLRKPFLQDDNGKNRHPRAIAKDIHALKHDMMAVKMSL